MVVARLAVDLPELRAATRAEPSASVRLADVRAGGPGPPSLVLWIDAPDVRGFDDHLETDPSVRAARRLTGTDGHALYRVDLAPGSAAVETYGAVVDLDGAILDATAATGSWALRVFFPDREALSAFYQRCRSLRVEPRLGSLVVGYEAPEAGNFGLTDAQRRTLLAATRRGYFAVPKEASLRSLADELGVSDQAVSERLRRGTRELIHHTLLAPGEEERA